MREDAIPYYPYEYTMSAVQRERYLLPSIGVVGDKEEKNMITNNVTYTQLRTGNAGAQTR